MALLILISLPMLQAVLMAACGRMHARCAGRTALWQQTWVLGLILMLAFDQREFVFDWIPEVNLVLRFRLDGLASLFLILTGIVTMVAIATIHRSGQSDYRMFALVLLLESALFGVFCARHFIPWFLCWEGTLIPAYLLVRLWGGGGAAKAALRFFMMTLGGSAVMLVGMLALQLAVGTLDFDALGSIASKGLLVETVGRFFGFTGLQGQTVLTVLAFAVLSGLAVKIPVVPLHAWLPAAYAEAPTAVTMLLTGLLSKMGVYAMLRIFLPVFREVLPSMAPLLSVLAVATVSVGAIAALAQTDMKRLLAYSSLNHLGYCLVALAAVAFLPLDRAALSSALCGTVLQAFNHGIISCALFFGISILEDRNRGCREMGDFGGLRVRTPVFCGLFGFSLFASMGLPGLSGFVGEFLIFNGAFAITPAAALTSVAGLLLTAVFLLRMMRQVFWGPLKPHLARCLDLSPAERLVFGGLVLLMVLGGVMPSLLLDLVNSSILELLDLLRPLP